MGPNISENGIKESSMGRESFKIRMVRKGKAYGKEGN